MDKKKFEKFINENRQKLIFVIIVLLVVTGILLIFINNKDNFSSNKTSYESNLYSEEEFQYSMESSAQSYKDSPEYEVHIHNDYDYDDYDYCKYSDYNCDHDDYDCYFDRKKNCEENEEDEEEGSTIIYILNERDEDRLLIDEYKYGYTYRSSEDYIKRHGEKIIIKDTNKEIEFNDDEYNLEKGSNGEYFYYEYNKFTKEYEKEICYITAPKDKLFYTKCPGY